MLAGGIASRTCTWSCTPCFRTPSDACRFAAQSLWEFSMVRAESAGIVMVASQVLFHLQTRQPAVLPPVCELFGLHADNDFSRPLHGKRPPDMALLEVSALDCVRPLF